LQKRSANFANSPTCDCLLSQKHKQRWSSKDYTAGFSVHSFGFFFSPVIPARN